MKVAGYPFGWRVAAALCGRADLVAVYLWALCFCGILALLHLLPD